MRFVDADANKSGFQAAALIGLHLEKTVTQKVGIDLDLPDLGPVTIDISPSIDFTVSGKLDLGVGFNLSSFTPYIVNNLISELSPRSN